MTPMIQEKVIWRKANAALTQTAQVEEPPWRLQRTNQTFVCGGWRRVDAAFGSTNGQDDLEFPSGLFFHD